MTALKLARLANVKKEDLLVGKYGAVCMETLKKWPTTSNLVQRPIQNTPKSRPGEKCHVNIIDSSISCAGDAAVNRFTQSRVSHHHGWGTQMNTIVIYAEHAQPSTEAFHHEIWESALACDLAGSREILSLRSLPLSELNFILVASLHHCNNEQLTRTS